MTTPRFLKPFNLATQQQKVQDCAAVRFTPNGQIYFTKKSIDHLELASGRLELLQDPENPGDWYVLPRSAAHDAAFRLKFAAGRNGKRQAGAYFHSMETVRDFFEALGREPNSESYAISLHPQDYFSEEGQKHPDRIYPILTTRPLTRKVA